MGLSDFWNSLTKSPAFRVAAFNIPPERVDIGDKLKVVFEPHKQYFEVRINQMYLNYKRKWFKEYDPAVFIVSEFLYNKKIYSVPFVVGPSMLEGKMDKVPDGMLFQDTTVAGLHPFRGGDFNLSVVLARMQTKDYLRRFMKFVESTAGTYTGGFATLVDQYSKVANVVLDSLDELLGSEEVEPLIGYTIKISTNTQDFSPGFFLLLNSDEQNVDPSSFFIKGNRLMTGTSLDDCEPYRDDDYVLYSIVAAPKRNDTEALPVFQQFEDLQSAFDGISDMDATQEKLMRAKLFSLQDKIRLSPDLIKPQMAELISEYKATIESMIEERKSASGAADAGAERDAWDVDMDKQAMEILSGG